MADVDDLADLLCSNRCGRLADGWLDGEGPLCVDCADRFIERAVLVELFPALRETMAPVSNMGSGL